MSWGIGVPLSLTARILEEPLSQHTGTDCQGEFLILKIQWAPAAALAVCGIFIAFLRLFIECGPQFLVENEENPAQQSRRLMNRDLT